MKVNKKKLLNSRFDFRLKFQYERDCHISKFNSLYSEKIIFNPHHNKDRKFYHKYNLIRNRLEKNNWKLWDAEETESKNVDRDIVLGLDAGVDKFIELTKVNTYDTKLDDLVKKLG